MSIKSAYGAGYRAGMCGADWSDNPFSGNWLTIFHAVAWGEGHHRGLVKRLNNQAAEYRAAEGWREIECELAMGEFPANDNIYGADICNAD